MRRLALLVAAAAFISGCGSSESKTTSHARAAHPTRPDETPCRALGSRTAAHRLARKLVDRVVAPEKQSERQTIGIIGESLYATCKQPRLPGVRDMKVYRPVKPVLAAIQREFDEEEITGG